MTLQPIAYLSFDGTCQQAMTFYAQALGGQIKSMTFASQTPCAEGVPGNPQDFVVNCQLEVPGGGMLMAGDHMPHLGPYPGMKGFTLALNYDSVDEASQRFIALSEGGQIQMPLQPSFWAKVFGICTDQFGTPWIVSGELVPVGQEALA